MARFQIDNGLSLRLSQARLSVRSVSWFEQKEINIASDLLPARLREREQPGGDGIVK